MKPWVKDLVGVISHVPGAYLLYFLFFFIWMLTQLSHTHTFAARLPQGSIFLGQVLVSLLVLAFYYVWLLIGSGFTLERKILWAVGLLFGAPVTMPLLYWIYLRKLPPGPYVFGRPFNGWPWSRS